MKNLKELIPEIKEQICTSGNKFFTPHPEDYY